MNELNKNSIDGVKKLSFNDNEYTFWHKADVVLPYIRQFLKQKFPDDYILSEFNRLDFAVIGQNLPVEVQSTLIVNKSLHHSSFEQLIQKQIKQNINRYNKCWFFMDSEYLRYLQNETSNKIRLNFNWFLEYIKQKSLEVFIINFQGKIKHLSYDDLKFLNNFSNPDLELLKVKVYFNVIHDYGYTSEEIREYRNMWKLSKDSCQFTKWARKREQPERIRNLGHVLYVMCYLKEIDDFLFRKSVKRIFYLSYIGMLNYKHKNYNIKDQFNILQFFPGYIENKEFWDGMKEKEYKYKEFLELILDEK